jgi:hypothetical protein
VSKQIENKGSASVDNKIVMFDYDKIIKCNSKLVQKWLQPTEGDSS